METNLFVQIMETWVTATACPLPLFPSGQRMPLGFRSPSTPEKILSLAREWPPAVGMNSGGRESPPAGDDIRESQCLLHFRLQNTSTSAAYVAVTGRWSDSVSSARRRRYPSSRSPSPYESTRSHHADVRRPPLCSSLVYLPLLQLALQLQNCESIWC